MHFQTAKIDTPLEAALPQLVGLGWRRRRQVLRQMRAIRIDGHRLFIWQGEAGRDLHVITAGHAKVFDEGTEVATLGPGDFVGEIAMLTGGRRTASVLATDDLDTVVMNRREFRAVLDLWPQFGMLATRAACRHLGTT